MQVTLHNSKYKKNLGHQQWSISYLKAYQLCWYHSVSLISSVISESLSDVEDKA